MNPSLAGLVELEELVVLALPPSHSHLHSRRTLTNLPSHSPRSTQSECIKPAHRTRTILGAHLEVKNSCQQERRLDYAQLASTYLRLVFAIDIRLVT